MPERIDKITIATERDTLTMPGRPASRSWTSSSGTKPATRSAMLSPRSAVQPGQADERTEDRTPPRDRALERRHRRRHARTPGGNLGAAQRPDRRPGRRPVGSRLSTGEPLFALGPHCAASHFPGLLDPSAMPLTFVNHFLVRPARVPVLASTPVVLALASYREDTGKSASTSFGRSGRDVTCRRCDAAGGREAEVAGRNRSSYHLAPGALRVRSQPFSQRSSSSAARASSAAGSSRISIDFRHGARQVVNIGE